jgi:hypothetical protein
MRSSPRSRSFAFYQKKSFSSETGRSQGLCFLHYKYSVQLVGNNSQGKFEKVFSSVCMPTAVVSLDHLPPIPPASSGMNTPGDRQGP